MHFFHVDAKFEEEVIGCIKLICHKSNCVVTVLISIATRHFFHWLVEIEEISVDGNIEITELSF